MAYDNAIQERFWSKIDMSGPCWVWLGCRRKVTGTGAFAVRPGFTMDAHRFAWEVLGGADIAGKKLDWRCGNHACVNPDHLFIVQRKVYQKRDYMAATRRRFWVYVDKSGGPNACWIWTGSRLPTGYGRISFRGKADYATRVVWELTHGPIPPGLHVLHRCDNPPCCNPAHLWLGTPAENMHDRDAKGRNGTLGKAASTRKLTDSQAREIRYRLEHGLARPSDIIREYKMNWGTLAYLRAGKTYKTAFITEDKAA